jgi:hypothetical protein
LSRIKPCLPVHVGAALTLSAALVSVSLLPVSVASAQGVQPVPFATFLDGLTGARSADFVGRPAAAVQNNADFEEIRHHLLKLYEGQDVRRSVVSGGRTFDCMPIAQQPAVRIQGLRSIAAPPPFPPQVAFGKSATPADELAGQPAAADKLACPKGSFAMPRLTLEHVARFGTLRAFFEKGPNGAGRAHEAGEAKPNFGGHAYAYAYQNVNNWGGQSVQSLNDPYVNRSLGEVFSLMQNWYVGGSGTGLQTAEVGWQNYPAKYGTEASVLFAYYTADGYNHTGCYNYDCGAFVQYSGAPISLGQHWSTYSVPGGAQYIITIGYYLYAGNWWLAYGTGWVGYYPGSLYGTGQLRYHATTIEYGTESVGTAGWWPPEGSGYWPSSGWPYSGYQRTIYYRGSSGAFTNPSLTSARPSPSCYSDTNQAWGGSTWQYYFYLGGPGGTGC